MVRADRMLLPLLLALFASFALADVPAGGEPVAWSEAPAATWTIVLQTEGPLRADAEAAREPIARLIEVLPVGDRVEVVAIHTRSVPVLPLRTVDVAGRATLAAELRSLEIPSAKSTDLGAAFFLLATGLAPTPEGAAHFVLMVANFCHSPPLESVYANGGSGCRTVRGFDKLDAAFDAGASRGTTEVVLFPTGTEASPVHRAGLAEARTFFGPTAGVETAAQPFADWMEAARARIAATRLRPLVRAEALALALQVRVGDAPTLERPTGTLVLGTGLPHLGFAARGLTLQGATTTTTELTLAPENVLPFSVAVPEPPFSFLPAHDVVEIPLRIHLDGELAPAATLRALGVDPARTGLEGTVVLQVARAYGLSPLRSFGLAVSLALLSVATVLTAQRRLRPLRLGGTFSYRRAGGPRQTLAIEHLADAPIVILPDGSLGVGRRDGALLVLRVERPLWNMHATAEIRAQNTEINARPATPGRHPVVPGATSFQFRDYRLSWE